MGRGVDTDRFPQWRPFLDAVQQRRPDSGTWCEAWTVRDIVAHQAGNAEELARVLASHLAGETVETRGFEREKPYRAMNNADLWAALVDRMETLSDVAEAADAVPADTDVAWTGRTMKVPWFAEHMREELVLHGWDVTGDDAPAQARLAEPWMTDHSVFAVGVPLLALGSKKLGLAPGQRVEARLRVAGSDDVAVTADTEGTTIELVEPNGPATLETDAAARVLLLWGRRPANPSRTAAGSVPRHWAACATFSAGTDRSRSTSPFESRPHLIGNGRSPRPAGRSRRNGARSQTRKRRPRVASPRRERNKAHGMAYASANRCNV